jgi:hypothetical protein
MAQTVLIRYLALSHLSAVVAVRVVMLAALQENPEVQAVAGMLFQRVLELAALGHLVKATLAQALLLAQVAVAAARVRLAVDQTAVTVQRQVFLAHL